MGPAPRDPRPDDPATSKESTSEAHPPDLDALVRRKSAFESFQDLLDAKGHYRPTISIRDADDWALVRAYDAAQAARGTTRRAFTAGCAPQAGDPVRCYAFGGERYARLEKIGPKRLLVSYVTKVEARPRSGPTPARPPEAGPRTFTPHRNLRYFSVDRLEPVETSSGVRLWRVR